MYNRSVLMLALLFGLNGCATKQESIANVDINNTTITSDAKMVSYINNIRSKGATCAPAAPPLQFNSALKAAAAAHAKDMALSQKLSHIGSGTATDPAKKSIGVGSTHIDRILYFGFPKRVNKLVGEEITYTKFNITGSQNYDVNFKKAISNLMNDREHCKNIMNRRFTDIGMAMYKANDRYYFVMDLGENR